MSGSAKSQVVARVETEFELLKRQTVSVSRVMGFVGTEVRAFLFDPPVGVRIDEPFFRPSAPSEITTVSRGLTDLERWEDWGDGSEHWLAPFYRVNTLQPLSALSGVALLHIAGTHYCLETGHAEAGDIVGWPVSPVRLSPDQQDECSSSAKEHSRRGIAEAVWNEYDFGPLVVAETSGWEYSTHDPEWRRSIFVEQDRMAGATVKLTFAVRFNPDDSLAEAYAIDDKGQIWGSSLANMSPTYTCSP